MQTALHSTPRAALLQVARGLSAKAPTPAYNAAFHCSAGAGLLPSIKPKRAVFATSATLQDGSGLATNVPASMAWDPDGLLPAPAPESHFVRRERQRATAMGLEMQQQGGVRPIPPKYLAVGGLLAADGSLYDRAAFKKQMSERFLPMDLDTPDLRIMHFDPPVFTLPAFFTEKQCDEFVDAALASDTLVPSKVGGGNLRDMLYAADNPYRTSSSILLDTGVQAAHPRLRAMARALQAKGLRLVGHGDGSSWGAAGKLPRPGQYCYESLQMARYEAGQHFLAHEDGFPASLARQNGFQRHATLLVYLNTTQEGGATRFDMLNLSVQPHKGTALLFFPAFSDGVSDSRSLHTAEDAVDTKWVTQQWIARGLESAAMDPVAAALAGDLPVTGNSAAAAPATAAAATVQLRQPQRRQAAGDEGPSAAEALLAGKRGKGKGKGKKGASKPGGKGFGAGAALRSTVPLYSPVKH